MINKDRIFKKEYAKELLTIAENDLVAANALKNDKNVRYETVLLMAQQAVKKSLKSVLCILQKPIPMTHDVYLIIDRLGEEHKPPHYEYLDDLTPYATIRRYKEEKFEITENDIAFTLNMVKDVLFWCNEKILKNA